MPGSIALLIYFIVAAISWGTVDMFNLIMVVGALGLPGMVIILVTGHIGYVFWMIIYMISLPIWNLILPIYAFSKFDDFSWGETRKVVGDKKTRRDPMERGSFLIGSVPLKRYIFGINISRL